METYAIIAMTIGFVLSIISFILSARQVIRTRNAIKKTKREGEILLATHQCPNCHTDSAIWDGRHCLPNNKTVEAFKCIDCGFYWEMEI
jgi:DNA-directed RNA polymerase subunit M/transcription elongation factor TFIIS